MTDLHDFDAALAEHRRARAPEPRRVQLFGQEWELPAEAPASVILAVERAGLQLARMQRAGKVDPAAVVDETTSTSGLLEALVGADVLAQWLAPGRLTADDLPHLLARLVAIYTDTDPDAADPVGGGAGPEGNRAARRKAARTTTTARPKKATTTTRRRT